MKHIKRFLILIIILSIAFIIVNSRTRFFKDIDKHMPFLGNSISQSISDFSESIDKTLSHIPSPRELIARIRNVELPIDLEDVAENVYVSNDIMLNFYGHRNISVSLAGNELDIFGITDNENDLYLVYQFLDSQGEILSQTMDYTDSEGRFRRQVKIPDNAYQLAVYTGKERSGEFMGYIYDYVLLTQNTDGSWSVKTSPVYEDNITLYEKPKSRSVALRSTYNITHRDGSIENMAQEITANCENDYDKALALHNWICENIYYDEDSITDEGNTAPYTATQVLRERRAVCLGYANLYAAFLRSLDIPANVVAGYGLGVGTGESRWNGENISSNEANHAWNEVYIDNRWVIVDTTWDSKNKIRNGVKIRDNNYSHLYFDANLKFFSNNHKIVEYKK